MKRWIAGWRPCLVPLLLLALAAAPDAAAQNPSLTIASTFVTEGDSGTTQMTFTVVLTPASSQIVTVDWADARTGTATLGTDYPATAGGTLTFYSAMRSRTFTVAVTGDDIYELNETIVVTLSNATNATIATGTGTGTIKDDDGPTVSIDSPSVTEGDSGTTNLTFTATLSASPLDEIGGAWRLSCTFLNQLHEASLHVARQAAGSSQAPPAP